MASAPLVSIVFLNYNGMRHSSLWESIFTESYSNKEIIFVDNGSTDSSDTVFVNIATKHPEVQTRIVRLDKNVGYSEANNIGFALARGEIVCLLSNDIKVTAEWIQPIIAAFDRAPSVGIAGSMLFSVSNPTQRDRMGNFIDILGFNHPYRTTGGPAEQVFYSEGAVMFIRRSLIERLGYLFPPDYFMMFEDVDLCWRAALVGFHSVICNESIAYHVRGGTVSGIIMKRNPVILRCGTRNRLSTLFTNYGRSSLLMALPCSLLLEIVKALLLFKDGMQEESRASIGGVLAFLSSIPELWSRRGAVQAARTVDERTILGTMIGPGEGIRMQLHQWRLLHQGLSA